ncbi:short chain dehydrogenase [Vibrio sp. HA2012]|uniref:SDR family oxidoreductase n=1 Tax=Vibrio sp. HA2012 TaxID=1971595 RepID=UPI000C2BF150|nr:SDR family oxidoreductase [Vibrio sp. HA2012]PJC86027.1 short chain dehydrogenase [Vibrio sp. HA2012]
MDLRGKYVLLTGASGGIGRAIATELESQGAHLVLVGRNEVKLEHLHQSLGYSGRHMRLRADLTTLEGMNALQQQIIQNAEKGIKISVLINNAGSNRFSALIRRSSESIEKEIQLNLTTPILLTRMSLEWLERPGIVLNIGSTFGSIGYPGYATYCAAKSGIHRFSEAMDRELNGSGIRVLYLAPRATDTELNCRVVNQLNKRLGNACDQPETVAVHVSDMLQREKSVKWIGWPEKLFARINQILPGMISRSINKQKETIYKYMDRATESSDKGVNEL